MKFILLVSIKRLVLSKKRNFYEFIEFYVKGQDAGQGHVDHFITTKCLRNVKSLQKKLEGSSNVYVQITYHLKKA